jgi:predicted amino acid racemase
MDKINLANASYAESTGTSITVVSAGANTSGVHIKHAIISGYGSGNEGELVVNGNHLLRGIDWNIGYTQSIQDVFVPAGQAITIDSGHANNAAQIWFEVL